MNRGPQSGRAAADHVTRANIAWGNPPEWIIALAEACNKTNQSAVARRLNYSVATVSLLLSNTYRGDLDKLEGMVRGILMAETLLCPALGAIARNACFDWQQKPFDTTNSHRVRMYQACRNSCPHSRVAPPSHVED